MTNQIKPWDRQHNETSKAYQAFVVFREMGLERGCEKVAKELRKSGTLIWRWSNKYNWKQRITEYDSHVSSELDKQYITKAKEVNKEHLELLEKSRKSLAIVIVTLNKKLENGGFKELESWSLEKLFDYLKVCLPRMEQVIKLERLLRGLPNEPLEITEKYEESIEKRYTIDKELYEILGLALEDVYAERSKGKTALEIKPTSEISGKSKH